MAPVNIAGSAETRVLPWRAENVTILALGDE